MRLMIVFGVFALFEIHTSWGQAQFSIPLSAISFELLVRSKMNAPAGRFETISDVRITHFWKSPKHSTDYRLRNITRLLADKNFDNSRRTVFYAHGYVENRYDESIQTILRAYFKHGGYNILFLDWANMGYGNYFTAAANSVKVGRELGRSLVKLVKSGLRLDGLHLVGHSLGAHICGHAAKSMAAKGIVVPRVTGLDPALPGFYPPLDFIGPPLSADDAVFVDAIHTDGGRYGTPLPTAHADFWPNGGLSHQPGCTHLIPFTVEEFCSHWRSWRFWAESLSGGSFLSRSCESYDDFQRGSCSSGSTATIGVDTDTSSRGNFYLRTAANAPFALGERGAS